MLIAKKYRSNSVTKQRAHWSLKNRCGMGYASIVLGISKEKLVQLEEKLGIRRNNDEFCKKQGIENRQIF